MGTEPKWFLLFFIVGANLFRDVAGGLLQDPSSLQYTIIDYSEEDKGGGRKETTNNELITILSAMDMFAETVNKKIDSAISDRNDLEQNIKETIDDIVVEQTENITNHITNKIDMHLKKNTAIIRMMINLELNEMKNDMKAVLKKIDKSEINMRKEIEGLSNKINLLANVIQNSKQEKNCNSKDEKEPAQSVETTTERQFIETTTEQQNRIKDIISREERNRQAKSITPNIDLSKQNASKFTSLCDLDIPETIKKAGQKTWDTYWKPLADDLDLFVINQTGCTFTSLKNREPFYEPPLVYDGSLFEWRGALRAAENGDIVVQWADHAGYAFYIGLEGNRDTVFIQRSPWTDLVRRRTPGILSADRYVPFYIRIQDGVLTFGHECESEPMFTYDVSVAAGDPVYVSYYPFGPGGGKHLYQCPPATRAQPAPEIREEKQQKDETITEIVTKPVTVETTTEEQFTETTTEQQNRIKDIISREERNRQAISITPNIDVSKQNDSKFTSLCDLDIPKTIKKAEQETWDTYWKPLTDDLDLFVMNQTGCTFTSLKNREPFYEPPLVYDGSLFEWRGALRAAENGDIVVQWADHAGYAFYIGLEDNTETVFIQRSPWTDLVRRRTPGILSADRYVPFYIRIQDGVLTFGHECESEPMFTYDVSVAAGDPVYVSYYPFGPGGGKHLYQCPPAARAQPAPEIREETQQKEETETEVVTEIVTEPVTVEITTEEQFIETTTEQQNRMKDQNASKFTSLCDLDIPEAANKAEYDTWSPLADDLDLFVMNQTGCTFKSLGNRENFNEPTLIYDGSLFEWRGALRAAENGDIVVQWADHAGYAFYIGLEGNTETVFIQRSPWTDLVRRRTPGILSADRYVPFYIRIQDGVLTFGHECESEPMFTYDVSVAAGDPVYVSYYPFGPGGGKHLYQCPPAARAHPALQIREEKQSKEETPTEGVIEIVTEPITESVTKRVTEIVTEPVTKPATENITETVTELATDPVTENVTEPVTELVTKSVTEIVTELVTEIVTEPLIELVTESVSETVTEPDTEVTVTEIETVPETETELTGW